MPSPRLRSGMTCATIVPSRVRHPVAQPVQEPHQHQQGQADGGKVKRGRDRKKQCPDDQDFPAPHVLNNAPRPQAADQDADNKDAGDKPRHAGGSMERIHRIGGDDDHQQVENDVDQEISESDDDEVFGPEVVAIHNFTLTARPGSFCAFRVVFLGRVSLRTNYVRCGSLGRKATRNPSKISRPEKPRV